MQLMVQAGSMSIALRGTKRPLVQSVGVEDQLYPSKAPKQSFEE
jgi:hypothetical protein